MKSFIASLRSLVLPFGATTGARIVLDGVNGIIEVYNALGVVVGAINGAAGFVQAGGGVVQLDDSGISVQSNGGNALYQVNRTGGFVASNIPDDGAKAQITSAGMFLTPEDPSPLGNAVDFAEWNVGYDNAGAANETPWSRFNGVEYVGKSAPTIMMYGQRADDANPDSSTRMELDALHTVVTHRLISDNTGMDYPAAQMFDTSINVVVGSTGVASGAINYPVAFPVGAGLFGFVNIRTGSANVRGWIPQWLNTSNSQYEIVMRNALAGGAPATMNIPLNVAVFVVPS